MSSSQSLVVLNNQEQNGSQIISPILDSKAIFDQKLNVNYKPKPYKRIVFVNPFPYYAAGINEATVYPPIGLGTIARILEERNFDCKIIDANILGMTNDKVLEEINAYKADLVGIQVNIVTAKAGIELSKELKKRGIKVVLGGPFAQDKRERLIKHSKADALALGEGELTFLQICQGYKLEDIDGLFFLKNKKPYMTPPRRLIENIDDIPYPAYHKLPSLRLYKSRSRKTPIAPMFTTRGCPYQCTFCSSSSKTSVFQNIFRARSPENVVEEIEYLVKQMGVKQIDILDDNFTFNLHRSDKILDLILEKKLKVAINLQNGVRADRLTFDLVKKMKKAGVYKMGIGIESGNERILKSIKKSLDLKAVDRAVRWCKKVGIVVIGFFMLGFPEDTEETLKETIDYAIKLNPSIANFSLVIPLPGTELFDDVERKGYLTNNMAEGSESGFYAGSFNYETPHLKQETIFKYQKIAYLKFNLRPKKIFELIKDMRTMNEFMWTFTSATSLLKNMFGKHN